MIIGNGLIANGFSEYEPSETFLIFASGVSHSKSCTPGDFGRERQMLSSAIKANPSKKLVYFSTTSVNDPDLRETPYVVHKLEMEGLIRQSAAQWQVFRLSNAVGASDNPTTVLNFLFNSISLGHRFQLWKFSERNLIDIADIFRVCDHILQKALFSNAVVNIANPSNYPVSYIVKNIERFTGRQAQYDEIAKGSSFGIDVADIFPIYDELNMEFGEKYLPGLLKKYYSRP
jgi:nucleoside-diphosphate-sugar epimerase